MLSTPMSNQYLDAFKTSLEAWTDERFVSRANIQNLAMFSEYLVNLAGQDGWQYDGHSFKVGVPMCCLTVKATIDDIPQVVFTSGRTYISCVTSFLHKLEQGWLEWRKDRYRC